MGVTVRSPAGVANVSVTLGAAGVGPASAAGDDAASDADGAALGMGALAVGVVVGLVSPAGA